MKVRSGNEPETGKTPGSTPFGGLFRVWGRFGQTSSVGRTRLGERKFELPLGDRTDVSAPGQPVMASVNEHQLRGMHPFSGMGCVIDEGKGVVGALGDECWRCDVFEREWREIGFV